VSRATSFTPFCLLFGTEAITPEEIKNESMRVQKEREIEEIDMKVEKDMIELMILEAAENIEKYKKETKAWKDRKVVRKDIKTGDLVLKRKKNWENPRKLGAAIHSKGNKHVKGFPLDRPNRRRAAAFVECGQFEEVLPLRILKVVRFIFQHFFHKFNFHKNVKLQTTDL
jgi:hypothetical protein